MKWYLLWMVWGMVCGGALVYQLMTHPAHPAPAPAQAAVDTVYIERYWGMDYHTTKPGGVLIVEFSPVKKVKLPAKGKTGGR